MKVLRMMRGKRAVLTIVCTLMVMMLTAGCGQVKEKHDAIKPSLEDRQPEEESQSNEQPEGQLQSNGQPETDSQETDDQETGDQETDSQEKTAQDGQSNAMEDGQEASAPGNEELTGSVRSVGQDSFVISRTMTYSEGDAEIEVGAAPGSAEEELVTVYVDENCVYQYKTVKNAGINPEDTAEREGSFADMKEGLLVIVQGSWQDGSFHADSMVMKEMIW